MAVKDEDDYQSGFSQPKRSVFSRSHHPPVKHCIAQVTGGLEEIYTKIQSGWQNVEEDYSKCTSDENYFQPNSKVGLLAGRYQVVRVLGKGNSSTIIQAQDTFRPGYHEVAIKILKPEYYTLGYQESYLITELNKADIHNFSGIVKLLNTFTLGKSFFCMTFELLQPWPLHQIFKKISDKSQKLTLIRRVALRMLQILGFLGQQNVIHADLKPENILCNSENLCEGIKVIDFGNAIHGVYEELSLYYDEFELQTLLYRAPEVVLGLPFGQEIDMWSLGCILAECYMGKPLFWAKRKEDLLAQMISLLGPLPTKSFQRAKFFSQFKESVGQPETFNAIYNKLTKKLGCFDFRFITFIQGMLALDPGDRMTVAEAVQHPFIAPEMAIKFVLPTSSNGSGPSRSYSAVDLKQSMYTNTPSGASDSRNKHWTSLELLRRGTSGDTNLQKQVAGETTVQKAVHVVTPFVPGGAIKKEEAREGSLESPKSEPEHEDGGNPDRYPRDLFGIQTQGREEVSSRPSRMAENQQEVCRLVSPRTPRTEQVPPTETNKALAEGNILQVNVNTECASPGNQQGSSTRQERGHIGTHRIPRSSEQSPSTCNVSEVDHVGKKKRPMSSLQRLSSGHISVADHKRPKSKLVQQHAKSCISSEKEKEEVSLAGLGRQQSSSSSTSRVEERSFQGRTKSTHFPKSRTSSSSAVEEDLSPETHKRHPSTSCIPDVELAESCKRSVYNQSQLFSWRRKTDEDGHDDSPVSGHRTSPEVDEEEQQQSTLDIGNSRYKPAADSSMKITKSKLSQQHGKTKKTKAVEKYVNLLSNHQVEYQLADQDYHYQSVSKSCDFTQKTKEDDVGSSSKKGDVRNVRTSRISCSDSGIVQKHRGKNLTSIKTSTTNPPVKSRTIVGHRRPAVPDIKSGFKEQKPGVTVQSKYKKTSNVVQGKQHPVSQEKIVEASKICVAQSQLFAGKSSDQLGSSNERHCSVAQKSEPTLESSKKGSQPFRYLKQQRDEAVLKMHRALGVNMKVGKMSSQRKSRRSLPDCTDQKGHKKKGLPSSSKKSDAGERQIIVQSSCVTVQQEKNKTFLVREGREKESNISKGSVSKDDESNRMINIAPDSDRTTKIIMSQQLDDEDEPRASKIYDFEPSPRKDNGDLSKRGRRKRSLTATSPGDVKRTKTKSAPMLDQRSNYPRHVSNRSTGSVERITSSDSSLSRTASLQTSSDYAQKSKERFSSLQSLSSKRSIPQTSSNHISRHGVKSLNAVQSSSSSSSSSSPSKEGDVYSSVQRIVHHTKKSPIQSTSSSLSRETILSSRDLEKNKPFSNEGQIFQPSFQHLPTSNTYPKKPKFVPARRSLPSSWSSSGESVMGHPTSSQFQPPPPSPSEVERRKIPNVKSSPADQIRRLFTASAASPSKSHQPRRLETTIEQTEHESSRDVALSDEDSSEQEEDDEILLL